jgi:hypothetical protein
VSTTKPTTEPGTVTTCAHEGRHHPFAIQEGGRGLPDSPGRILRAIEAREPDRVPVYVGADDEGEEFVVMRKADAVFLRRDSCPR